MSNNNTVGEISLELLLDSSKYSKQLNKIQGTADAVSVKMCNSFKKIGATIMASFSVAAISKFSKKCIDLGSDLQEVQNVVDTTFGGMSNQLDKWAKTTMTSYGLSEAVTKKYAGLYKAMANASGVSEQSAYDMSTALTGLAGDVASFYNISSGEAYTKLKSVFSGETETLKDIGIVMTQDALNAYALANGISKTVNEMTQAEKVSLRYKFVLNALSDAQGDFMRTSDGWANQTRVLSLRFDSIKATLGQGLINAFTPVLKIVNSLMAKLEILAEKFKLFTEKIFGRAGGSGGSNATAETISDIGLIGEEATASAEAIDGMAKIADKAKYSLAGFDELNILQKSDDTENANNAFETSDGTVLNPETATQANNEIKKTDGLLDKIKTKLKNFYTGSGLERLVGKFKNFGEKLKEQFEKVDLKSTLFKLFKTSAETAISAFDLISDIVLPIAVTLNIPQIVYTAAETLSKLFGTLKEIVGSVSESVRKFVNIALKPIAQWIGEKLVGVLKFFQEELSKIGAWFTANKSKFTSFFEDLGVIISTLWQVIKPILNVLLAIIKKITSALTSSLFKQIGVVFSQISGTVKAFAGVLSGDSKKIKDGLQSIWDGVKESFSVGGVFKSFFNSLEEEIDSQVENVFSDKVGKIKDDLKDAAQEMTSCIEETHKRIDEVCSDNQTIDEYQERLKELLSKADLTTAEQQELTTIADYLSSQIPEFQNTWDDFIYYDEQGKITLNENTDTVILKLDEMIDKYQEAAKIAALQEIYTENQSLSIEKKKELRGVRQQIAVIEDDKSIKTAELQQKMDEYNRQASRNGWKQMTWESLKNDFETGVGLGLSDTPIVLEIGELYKEIQGYSTQISELKSSYNELVPTYNAVAATGDDIHDVMNVLNGDYSDAAAVLMAYNEGLIDTEDIEKSTWESITNLRAAAAETGKNITLGVFEESSAYLATFVKDSDGYATTYETGWEDAYLNTQGAGKACTDALAGSMNNLGAVTRFTKDEIVALGKTYQQVQADVQHLRDLRKQSFTYSSQMMTYDEWHRRNPGKSMAEYERYFNVRVPHFATGAVVKAPTLAVVGDNRNAKQDPEVIAPLSKLRSMIGDRKPREDNSQFLSSILKVLEVIADKIDNVGSSTSEIDEDTLFDIIRYKSDDYKKLHGGRSAL